MAANVITMAFTTAMKKFTISGFVYCKMAAKITNDAIITAG